MIGSGTSSSWRWMRSAMGATSFRAKLRAESRAISAMSPSIQELFAPRVRMISRPISRSRASCCAARTAARTSGAPSVHASVSPETPKSSRWPSISAPSRLATSPANAAAIWPTVSAPAGVGGQRLGRRRLGRGVGQPLGVHLVLVDGLPAVGRPPPRGQRLVEHGAHGGDDEARLVAHAAHVPLPGWARPACAAPRILVDAGAGSVVARPARGVFGTMEIRSVGVLGAGQMGLGIAQAAARAGFDTIMAKATPGALDAQRARVEKQLHKDVERGRLTAADHGALLERLRWTIHLHDLADVDLVIESIVEELAVKRDHFGRLDEIVKAEAIFATNTSTLTVTELAAATGRPERFVGLHFF